MTLPFDSAVRLLRTLGLPLTPAETSPSRAHAGLPWAPHVTFPLAAESEDFELAPYPSPRFPPVTTNLDENPDSDDDYREGRTRTTSSSSSSSNNLTSRAVSPASSTCSSSNSTAGWSDSDPPITRPRRMPKPRTRFKTKPTSPKRDELEALWRRYWD